jgi:hypothetical protein
LRRGVFPKVSQKFDHVSSMAMDASCYLLVRALDVRTDASALQSWLSVFVPAAAVVAFDASRGAAHVQFATGDHARHALNALNATPGPYGTPLALQLVMPVGSPDTSATPPHTKGSKCCGRVLRNVASGVSGSGSAPSFAAGAPQAHRRIGGLFPLPSRGAMHPEDPPRSFALLPVTRRQTAARFAPPMVVSCTVTTGPPLLQGALHPVVGPPPSETSGNRESSTRHQP